MNNGLTHERQCGQHITLATGIGAVKGCHGKQTSIVSNDLSWPQVVSIAHPTSHHCEDLLVPNRSMIFDTKFNEHVIASTSSELGL